jgi:tetratricopeptide (TPR) repeat protein
MSKALSCIFLCLVIACIPFCSQAAAPAQDRYAAAGRAYREARYDDAIGLYEGILKDGYGSADLHYNLGNAYFKKGFLAKSILNFERAKLLNPGDDAIRMNLLIASSRVRDRVEPMPLLFAIRWWNSLKNEYSTSDMVLWSVLLLWLCAGCAFVFFALDRILFRRLALVAGTVLFLFFVATVFLHLDKKKDSNAHRAAIVVANTVTVKSTPDASGVDSFTIHEGLKVEITEARDSWVKIRLADGKDGWMTVSAVERI